MATTALSETIVKSIYGDVDLREFAKALDPSDVHIDGNVNNAVAPTQTRQQAADAKKLAVTGLAATGVAGVAGGHAISATLKENAARVARSTASLGRHAAVEAEAPTMTSRIARVAHIAPAKAAAVIGGAALGLHAVELVGDSLGAHAQIKSINASNKQLNKAFTLKPLNAEVAARVHSLRAKRPKMNPLPSNPRSVNGLHQPVAKKLGGVRRIIRNVEDVTESSKKIAGHATNAAQDAAVTAHKIQHLIPSRTGAAGIGVGAIGGVGAADYGARNAANKSAEKRYSRAQGPVEKSVTWTGTFSKVDEDKRQVFGWASVSEINGKPVVDLQGDIVPIEEIEKSAYKYVIESRKGGDMHARLGKSLFSGDQPKHTSDMIESFVVTPEKLSKMGLAEDALPLGWWVGFHVNDDQQWADVKAGDRGGFSIHGSGTRTPVSKAVVSPDAARRFGDLKRLVHHNKGYQDLREQAFHHPDKAKRAEKFDEFGRAVDSGERTKLVRTAARNGVTANEMVTATARSHPGGGVGRSQIRYALGTKAMARASAPDKTGSVSSANADRFADQLRRRGFAATTGIGKAAHRKEPGDRAQVPGRRRALDIGGGQHAVAVAPKQPWSLVTPKHSSSKIVRHVNRVKAASQKAGVQLSLMEDRGPLVSGIARQLIGKAKPTLRERASQAIHPPAVKLKPVNSSFITGLGYQKQTHRLAYKMGSGEKTRSYAYRVKPGAAAKVLSSPSPGKAYNTDVRNTAKRAKHYTPADRVRLFADPQVSKASTPIPPVAPTPPIPPIAPTPPAPPLAKPTKKPLKLTPVATPVNGS